MEIRNNFAFVKNSSDYQTKNKPNKQVRFTGNSLKNDKVSFSANPLEGEALRNTLQKTIINEIQPKFLKVVSQLDAFLGRQNQEIVNIVITAIGTGFVAPIFIAFNPFAKQDSDTKKYSALRQPVSAVLAIASQLGINQQWDKYMAHKRSVPGGFEALDLSMKPDENYLKRKFKKEAKNENKKLTAFQLEEMVSAEIEKQKNDYINKQKGGFKDLNGEDILKKLDINVDELDILHTKSQVDAEAIAKSLGRENDKKFIKNLKGKGEAFLTESKIEAEKINKIKIELLLDKLGVTAKDELTKTQLINNIKAEGGPAKFFNSLKNEIKDFKNIKAETLLTNMGSKLGKQIDKKPDMIKNTATKLFDNYVKVTESRFKTTKTWTGITLSLLTLPPVCTLLNWLYPRFIELVFPSLLKDKSKKGGK